jgi:WD40 repeat protein
LTTTVPTACPRCASKEIHFRQSRGDWVCDVCEHAWQPAAGTQAAGPTPGKARARLFLSYGRRDASDLANRLRADLEARGYEIWQDTRRIRSGTEWEEEIKAGLRQTQVVLAVLSPHSVRRATDPSNPDEADSICLDEISFARFARPPRPVVPVMAVTCEPPLSIYRLDYIDMRGALESPAVYEASFGRLLEAIEVGLRGDVQYRSWDHQLRPWDFSTFLNEKRQHFFGREWLFDEIERWRTGNEPAAPASGNTHERALLIAGDPGTGKSAIVAELVHRNPGGQVLAYHCCQADTKETLQPGRFVRNLAAMIASKLEGYAARLSDPAVEDALSEANCARDPASAFEAGILTPLDDLPAPEGGVRYLLIDALDEALAIADGPSRLTVVDVLAARFDRLPSWLRLVATTRKERAVLDRLRGVRILELDAHDRRNLADIDRYVAARLATPVLAERLQRSGLAAEQAAAALREKADGNILYVIRALEGIERDLYGFDNLGALPPGLYGLYLGFFNRNFPDEASFAPVRTVLEVIVAARAPLREERIVKATGLDRETELPRILRRLSAYLHEQDGRYSVYHKSFADWLTAPDQRGSPHYCSPKRGHERLADLFWKEYETDVANLSGYARMHLAAHLIEAGRWEQVARLLCDLKFIKAKCQAKLTYELRADYDLALDAWPGHQRHDPFEHAAPPPAPGWVGDCTAAILKEPEAGGVSVSEVHPDRGAGPMLAVLRALPADQREQDAQEPRYTPGQKLPDSQFGADQGSVAALAQIRRTEAAGPSGANPAVLATPEGKVSAFANFVGTYGHVLASLPGQTILLARNHAAGGIVAESAEALVRAYTERLWIARDPRPPALPLRPACLRTLEGHENRVNAVALTPDGKTAVSGSSDSLARVWDVEGGLCRRVLPGHRKSVRAVALAGNGQTVVTGSHDNHLRVWNLATGECQRVLRGHTNWVSGVAVSLDGKLAVSGSIDHTLRVWDVGTGKCLHTLAGHADEVRSVALSGDGRLAVSAGADTTLRVWDVGRGTCLRVLRGHTDSVNGVSLTPDGKTAVSAGRDLTVRVWDVASGACLRVLSGFANWVNAAAITPDGRLALTAGFDLTLRVWDLATGECLRVLHGHTAWVGDVAVTADGRLAVSAGSDHTLRVWDVASGESVPSLPRHAAWVGPVTLSAGGKLAVSPGRDNQARLWETETGRCLRTLEGHTNWLNAAVLTRDTRLALTASSDNTLRVWDVADGRCLHTLTGHTDWVHHVVLTPDNTLAVSGSSDKTVRVWDLATASCQRVLEGHTDWITFLSLTPDGRHAVSTGRDGSVRVWDLAAGTCVHTLTGHTDFIEGTAVTPDGRLAVSASNDRTVRVWDVVKGACRYTLEGHQREVENVAVSPDGRLALSPSRDYTVRVWDLATGACRRKLEGHRYGVTGVAVTPDCQLAVSSSWDNTVRVWDLATGECLAVYPAGARVAFASVGLGGRVVCGTSDGQVHFLKLRNYNAGLPLVTAVRLYRHDLAGRHASGLGRWLPFLGRWLGGEEPYERHLTAACPGCGQRFVPPAKVLEAIAGIGRNAGLSAEQPPCVTLPAEAWTETRLASACPHCRQGVRFNPFVVDNSPA